MNFTHGLDRFAFGQDHGHFILARLARCHGIGQLLRQPRADELCLPLGHRHAALLGDLLRLGPVGLLTPHEGIRAVQSVSAVDFKNVPESLDFVDLNGGLHLDAGEISSVLAVEEKHSRGSLISLQFLDTAGEGLLKLFTIPESNFAEFGQILARHAAAESVERLPPNPDDSASDGSPLIAELMLEQIRAAWDLHNPFSDDAPYAWTSLAGLYPGDFFPSLGPAFAEPATERFKAAFLLNAHSAATPMDAAAFSPGLRHRFQLTPRRLQECPHGIHLVDENAQITLPRQGLSAWRTVYGTSPGVCLEFLDAGGRRRLALRQLA